MDFITRGLAGLVLFLLGVAAFVPSVLSAGVSSLTLIAAAVLLTIGTVLVGTDVNGRPV